MANVTLHRGDDTDSFNGGLFKIAYGNPTFTIKKMEIVMGNVTKTVVNPTFPLQVNLRASESLINSTGKYQINLVIMDGNYRKLNIATGSTVTFADASTQIVIPYESPVLFDLSEVLPTNTNPDPDTEPDNSETEQNGESNSETNSESDNTNSESGGETNTETGDNTNSESGGETNTETGDNTNTETNTETNSDSGTETGDNTNP